MLATNPLISITMIHLDSMVNSKVSEYAPIEIDSLLYFSSLRNNKDADKTHHINYNKIYTAVEQKINWQKSKELDTLFNKEGIHNANTAFNNNFTKVYISRCKQADATNFSCEIYAAEFTNGHWLPL